MRTFHLHIIFCGLSLFIASAIYGQSEYSFTYMDTKDGLPSNRCYTVTMDSRGFIWVGTQFGLSRYDGISFYLTIILNTPALSP